MPGMRIPRQRLRAIAATATTLATLAVSAPVFAQTSGGAETPSATPPARTAAGPALGKPWPGPAAAARNQPKTDTALPKTNTVPGVVLVTLNSQTTVTGAPLAGKSLLAARAPRTSSPALDSRLADLGATSIRPLVSQYTAPQAGSGALDLSRTYVVDVGQQDSTAAARSLSTVAGVASAEPDRYVTTMNTGVQQVLGTTPSHPSASASAAPTTKSAAGVPTNYGLASSTQAFLNAGGVDAVGAFAQLKSGYDQLPGAGETITNVSVGDLTDQAMADAGDAYVQANGPTTIVQGGQRYLDLPSMPLIPTYVAAPGAALDPRGSTQNEDPSLGEVLLDFGVMSPLPHDRQRSGETGSGYTDLLGIAPGANYRLVVPQQPTTDQIAVALLAAARQSPRPDVITASLGFGTDTAGFPGRYLEDDPVEQAVVGAIVHQYHIVVSISSNDGTRLYTPVSVGPDGGSTPTDVTADPGATTSIDDDANSTTPTRVLDSGAIAAGGTTLDDTLAVPPGSPGALAATGTLAETRISGGGNFSSGFGSRVDLSAPSDGIVVFEHTAGGAAQDVTPVLSGGTSASAPEIAAAAAVTLQAARLAHHPLTPLQVRALLEKTGRPVATPPQIDQTLHVGPQVDVTAAVSALLPPKRAQQYDLVRLSLAHRVTLGGLGGTFLEETDQNRIDLGDTSQNGTGEGLVGPVTFAADVTGIPEGAHPDYLLKVGASTFRSGTPAIRVTPAQLLAAAGLPVVSPTDRQIQITFQVRDDDKIRASVSRTITIGHSDGTYAEAKAPIVAPVVRAGAPVAVHYDLTGLRTSQDPQLVVSTVGHWNPVLGPIFSAAHEYPLTAMSGTITLPSDAFGSGGGLYGVGIAQATNAGDLTYATYGEFAPVRVEGATVSDRPAVPTLAAPGSAFGHQAEVTRSDPAFAVHYDVGSVKGARSAVVEISAPGPTLFGAVNTFTNANGTTADDDGVDSPSVVRQAVAHTSGTVHLDGLRLGLATSMSYNVRVLAIDGKGRVIGQASGSSFLAVDDGLPPAGSAVLSFGAAGPESVVALVAPSGGTEVLHYSTVTGEYGPVIAADPGASSDYEVFGVAPSAHRVLVGHSAQPGGDLRIETYDTQTGALVGAITVSARDSQVVAGRVDPARGRGVLLLHAAAGGPDTLLPIDLTTGAAGPAIDADPPGVAGGTYALMDLDSSTGQVYLAKENHGLICFTSGIVARVDLGTGAVTGSPAVSGCNAALASDQAGELYSIGARSFSVNIQPTTTLSALDESQMQPGAIVAVRRGAAKTLAVDGIHHVALVAFLAPAGIARFGSSGGVISDNNATSQVLVVDLATGRTVRTLTGFDFAGGFGGAFNTTQERSIQLDPATRTGWTYGPYTDQVQQFAY